MDLVRVVVALVILTHPLYDLLHPDVVTAIGRATPAFGLPADAGVALAWAGVFLQIIAAAALLARRQVARARTVLLALVSVSALIFQWPDWYAVGGGEVTGHPGIELSVLLFALLAARTLETVRLATAAIIFSHAGVVLLKFEATGMRAWGEQMQAARFPLGVALVWAVVAVQAAASLALLVRWQVVLACVAQIFILANGIWTTHAPYWFVVGPGRSASRGWSPASGPDEGGMELSVLLIAGFVAVLLAHRSWQRSPASPGAAALPAAEPATAP